MVLRLTIKICLSQSYLKYFKNKIADAREPKEPEDMGY